jgi:hypothetical protein
LDNSVVCFNCQKGHPVSWTRSFGFTRESMFDVGTRSNLVSLLKEVHACHLLLALFLYSHVLVFYLYYAISCMVSHFLALEASNGINDFLLVLLIPLVLPGLVSFMRLETTLGGCSCVSRKTKIRFEKQLPSVLIIWLGDIWCMHGQLGSCQPMYH